MKEALLAEYDHETAATRRLLERIPDDRLSWRPHAKSRSIAELTAHISLLPEWGDAILNQPQFDLAAAPPAPAPPESTCDGLLSTFDDRVRAARAWLDKGDAELAAMWTLRRSGQEVFSMPRATAFRSFVLYHLVHHRGQLSVYLRLNDIPVPALYGPSADEP